MSKQETVKLAAGQVWYFWRKHRLRGLEGARALNDPSANAGLQMAEVTTANAAILLPHLLLSNLNENYVDSFKNLFCIPGCEAFWTGVPKVQDPRVAEPLAKSGAVQSREKCFPTLTMAIAVNVRTRIH